MKTALPHTPCLPQDAEPVKVAVGVYDSAYEGQRAAEAFSPPLWQEPAKDSR